MSFILYSSSNQFGLVFLNIFLLAATISLQLSAPNLTPSYSWKFILKSCVKNLKYSGYILVLFALTGFLLFLTFLALFLLELLSSAEIQPLFSGFHSMSVLGFFLHIFISAITNLWTTVFTYLALQLHKDTKFLSALKQGLFFSFRNPSLTLIWIVLFIPISILQFSTFSFNSMIVNTSLGLLAVLYNLWQIYCVAEYIRAKK